MINFINTLSLLFLIYCIVRFFWEGGTFFIARYMVDREVLKRLLEDKSDNNEKKEKEWYE